MNEIIGVILNRYQIFLLVFVRATGIFIITPIFSRRNVPNTLKIGFAFFITLIVYNLLNLDIVIYDDLRMVGLIIQEFAIGLILGFIAYAFFTSLYVAGQIIDVQIGFGMVNVLDPQHNIQLPITGNFYYILAVLIFLLVNGHHTMITALVDSFQLIPIGEFTINVFVVNQMIDIFGQVFIIGIKIAIPIVATMFLANVLLGILARTVPQMNVFVVGMPFKIIVGLLVLIFTLPIIVPVFEYIYDNIFTQIHTFMRLISRG